jgi:hypothetical protein
MDQLEELLAVRAIETVLMRYTRGMDRLDRDMMRSVFLPDATTDHPPFHVGLAWDFIDRQLDARDTSVLFSHLLGNVSIEVRESEARTESLFWSWGRLTGAAESDFFVAGRYLDQLVLAEHGWKVRTRRVVQDLVREVPVVGPIRQEGANGGLRSRDDVVYHALWTP